MTVTPQEGRDTKGTKKPVILSWGGIKPDQIFFRTRTICELFASSHQESITDNFFSPKDYLSPLRICWGDTLQGIVKPNGGNHTVKFLISSPCHLARTISSVTLWKFRAPQEEGRNSAELKITENLHNFPKVPIIYDHDYRLSKSYCQNKLILLGCQSQVTFSKKCILAIQFW